LPVLEEGRLTDAGGRTVNFRNTIIIMTSNIGIEQFNNQAAIGFDLQAEELSTAETKFAELSQNISSSLADYFRPEFLNRIDKTIIFKPLTKAVAKKIVAKELANLKERLAEKDITLELNPLVVNYLIEHGFHVQEGARSLKRIFQELVTNPVAERLLGSQPVKQLTVKVEKDKLLVTK